MGAPITHAKSGALGVRGSGRGRYKAMRAAGGRDLLTN